MNNLGGWHQCYGTNRAISNELGGKWELFDTVEFNETETENLLYDKDLDNETPLNLNGVMFIFKKNTTNSQTNYFGINNNTEVRYGTATNVNYTTCAISQCRNGIINTFLRTTQVSTTFSNVSSVQPYFENRITKFNYRGTFYSGDKIEIYVLRGV